MDIKQNFKTGFHNEGEKYFKNQQLYFFCFYGPNACSSNLHVFPLKKQLNMLQKLLNPTHLCSFVVAQMQELVQFYCHWVDVGRLVKGDENKT